MTTARLAIIGGGVMGEVLAKAVTATSLFDPAEVWVIDHNPLKLEKLFQSTGVNTALKADALEQVELLLLAIKPDNVAEVLSQLPWQPDVAISIMAGIPISLLASFLGEETPIIRVMTNTPCLVNEGMSVLSPNEHVSSQQLQLTQSLFEGVGQCLVLPEKYLDAVTGLSGSGPGFIFLIVDALIEAGVLQGLPRGIARQLVLQTVLGSAKLIETTDGHPAQLRDMVTSPGGTTIAGIQVMEEYKIRATLLKTIETATRRSRELGQQKMKDIDSPS